MVKVRQLPRRQRYRKALLFLSLLLFPVTLYYFSPMLILQGASQGIINGSFIVFGLMFLVHRLLDLHARLPHEPGRPCHGAAHGHGGQRVHPLRHLRGWLFKGCDPLHLQRWVTGEPQGSRLLRPWKMAEGNKREPEMNAILDHGRLLLGIVVGVAIAVTASWLESCFRQQPWRR